jgi:hypothetical protein
MSPPSIRRLALGGAALVLGGVAVCCCVLATSPYWVRVCHAPLARFDCARVEVIFQAGGLGLVVGLAALLLAWVLALRARRGRRP